MMNNTQTYTKAIELIMNNLNQGVVYIDNDRKIQICNRKAKEITGIMIDSDSTHDSGKIEEGDIVVIADNKLGGDDGQMTREELLMLNINDSGIKEGDMIVAIGVYKNKEIQPQYKYIREPELNVPLKLNSNYFGFHIVATIDTAKKETTIQVNDFVHTMPYFSSIGNVVIIDGQTGFIKFFQARGYSIRNEELGNLLRGNTFQGKTLKSEEIDVVGKTFTDLFNPSELTDKIMAVLGGSKEVVYNKIYDINQRPFICNIVPWHQENSQNGLFLLIQAAENLESLLLARNEVIKQLEQQHKALDSADQKYVTDAFDCFAGQSNKANEVKYMAYKASQNKFNVIITGESGTGKSIIARAIHQGWNSKAPFVEVNCNAIAPTLFESELFGYVGGAFTGAKTEGKIGLFEAADGGTIFLDEIGEIPLDIQVKLLHVLQNKMIYRVGSSKPIKIDVRVIAATNRNLEQEVASGNFRQDLFYRINVFPIQIPPLRERKSDLYLLINQILQKTCQDYNREMKFSPLMVKQWIVGKAL